MQIHVYYDLIRRLISQIPILLVKLFLIPTLNLTLPDYYLSKTFFCYDLFAVSPLSSLTSLPQLQALLIDMPLGQFIRRDVRAIHFRRFVQFRFTTKEVGKFDIARMHRQTDERTDRQTDFFVKMFWVQHLVFDLKKWVFFFYLKKR